MPQYSYVEPPKEPVYDYVMPMHPVADYVLPVSQVVTPYEWYQVSGQCELTD